MQQALLQWCVAQHSGGSSSDDATASWVRSHHGGDGGLGDRGSREAPFDLCFRLEAADPWSCFDVGVADPTRHGYLPTGNRFFKRAQAAERYAGKKKAAYAALVRQHSLKKKVDYAPVIFEVSGGFPDSVSQLLSKATEVASKNKVKLAASDWSWSAMDWSSFHAQVLSFEINKMTALAVLNGLRSAVAAVEAAN